MKLLGERRALGEPVGWGGVDIEGGRCEGEKEKKRIVGEKKMKEKL